MVLTLGRDKAPLRGPRPIKPPALPEGYLLDDLAGESPASANCPVDTVDISGDRAGDQTVGNPDVNVLDGRTQVWSALTGGKQS